ncbi:MAG TPA: methyltransferase domain-containing protein [Chloroflexi bacterium]|nr:methyltransferase domain-containing protein [Chloroflexota bacterium]
MRLILLNYLVCPDCLVAMDCQATDGNDDDVETGLLRCPQCGECYPILRGIPRFVTAKRPLNGKNVETADAFGWQWQKFSKVHDLATCEAQFLDWIYPIEPEFFEGKVVLDAGCGMGRFSLASSALGARMVLAIDASDAVEAARHNTRDFSNVHVIQGDIHHLPLRRGQDAQVDFVFSIGVLHHLDDPQAGFNALIQHLRRDGTIFVWVYGRENNGWLVNVVNPIRTMFTSRLPRRALYVLSWLITVGLHPILKLVYRPANAPGVPGWLNKILPYNDYLAWLGQFQFDYTHNVVFDHLVAPVAFYLRREEFAAWFHEADMEIIDISWRNRNSWRGHGRFAQAEEHLRADND